MKAIDYYEKYKDANLAAETNTLKQLFIEFNDEAQALLKKRNIKRDSAVIAVINEQNLKWNALCNLFTKNLGTCVLKKDGFKTFWSNQLDVGI